MVLQLGSAMGGLGPIILCPPKLRLLGLEWYYYYYCISIAIKQSITAVTMDFTTALLLNTSLSQYLNISNISKSPIP